MKSLFGGLLLLASSAVLCFGQGYFEDVSCTTLSGWAYQTSGNPSTVLLYKDGNSVAFASTVANLYRSDVQASIGGNGLNGFNIVLPSSLQDNASHTITAAVSGGSALTLLGSNTVTCSPQTPYYGYNENTATTSGTNGYQPNDLSNWSGINLASGATGGSYIWNQLPSSWNSEYEVKTTLSLNASGGTFQHYLRAQSNSVSGQGGDAIIIELENPTFTNGPSGPCTATLAALQTIGGSTNRFWSTTVSCSQTMVMRSVIYDGSILIWLGGNQYFGLVPPSPNTTGLPGFGAENVPAGSSVQYVQMVAATRPRLTRSMHRRLPCHPSQLP